MEFDELPNGLDRNSGGCLNERLIPYYAEHYSRLADHCPFVEKIDYHYLERYFDQIPENFIKRFVNLIHFIAYNEINNQDQLIKVLGECKTITRLELPSSLGQHFFDFHLYDLCPNIDTLHIFGGEVLNLEFIFKFKYIRELTVYQTESIEFVKRLVESYKNITFQFNYFYNQDLFEITIYKNTDKHYVMLRKGDEGPLVLNSLDDLYNLESYLENK